MPDASADRRDFFISFNSADRAWAEWIAHELEAAGYTTYYQHWDFAPGSNFVLEMHRAASQAERTIAVLSQHYLDALFTQPEWAAALVQDPDGAKRTLLPVRVQSCRPGGILKSIVYADLVGLDEPNARKRLLAAVQGGRSRPTFVNFPGRAGNALPTKFPGPSTTPSPPPPSESQTRSSLPFAWYLLALLGAALLVAFAPRLERYGLVNHIYYIVLVALASAPALLLFAGTRSAARYRAKHPWGVLELQGPVAFFCVVMAGGFIFAPGQKSFALTVFVHGPGGPQDLILRSEGRVAIDLGSDRRIEPIGEKGTAYFAGIPPEFRGKDIPVSILADGYARTQESPVHVEGDSLYVPVKKQSVTFSGIISSDTHDPIQNATIQIAGRLTRTDGSGYFTLTIPGNLIKQEMNLDVRAEGYLSETHAVVPNSNEIRLSLRRRSER